MTKIVPKVDDVTEMCTVRALSETQEEAASSRGDIIGSNRVQSVSVSDYGIPTQRRYSKPGIYPVIFSKHLLCWVVHLGSSPSLL